MKLSIITINYNNVEGLVRTLQSIASLKEAGCDFEYIVIDGGSTDGGAEVIKEYADRIDYCVSEPDKGIYNAMNKGIAQAKGEYLLFINSGDLIIEGTDMNRIAAQLTGEDIIYYNIEVALDGDENNKIVKKSPDFLDFHYFVRDAIPHQATFIKRTRLVEYGGYDENMTIFSDWAFFMDAICKLGYSHKYVDDHFSTFFQDGISSKSENVDILNRELVEYIEKSFPLYNRLYKEWNANRKELNQIKGSKTIQWMKKIGLIKWFKTYEK